jgi:HAD superfamily hydrolase (TIGR01490 family)
MPEQAKPDGRAGYAFFDLDHTLLPFDTQLLFCNHVLQRERWRMLYLLVFVPVLPLVLCRLMSLREAKRFFMSYLWRMRRARLEEHVRRFVKSDVLQVVYPEQRKTIERHRAEGRLLVLNSASPDLYAGRIAEALGMDASFATRTILRDPMPLLVAIDGPNNKHAAKIPRMAELLPTGFQFRDDGEYEETIPGSYAYSDSHADLPLLLIAEHAVMVHPTATLAEAGKARGWKTICPPRPYEGKWSSRLANALQALGLYNVKKAAARMREAEMGEVVAE